MKFLKSLIPNSLLKLLRPIYHGFLAKAASIYYGSPSKKLFVIGITGTVGKSTTAAMLSHLLNETGHKAGYMTTINFFDGEKDHINKHGLSMPGGPRIQKQLKQILDNGCKYAIVECTSEGLAQNRHLGINFRAALFTNISEAHIQAHGSFENYLKAKERLFETLKGKKETILGVNKNNDYAGAILSHDAEKKFTVSFEYLEDKFEFYYDGKIDKEYIAKYDYESFELLGQKFIVNIIGDFNKANALMAVACTNMLGVDLEKISKALESFRGVRGRMEEVENSRNIKIFVDYGCEPASFKAALDSTKQIPHRKIIHVFGSTGGHRDISKRFYFGQTSAAYSDEIIVTNDDVYDSDPEAIADDIERGIKEQAKNWSSNIKYQTVLDRRSAISSALKMAKEDDLVLITGKGSEQFLSLPGNKRIAWDEVSVVKEELSKL